MINVILPREFYFFTLFSVLFLSFIHGFLPVRGRKTDYIINMALYVHVMYDVMLYSLVINAENRNVLLYCLCFSKKTIPNKDLFFIQTVQYIYGSH